MLLLAASEVPAIYPVRNVSCPLRTGWCQKAPAPFGVPSPVGPSQPARALHHCVVGHVPLLPDVTSNRFPGWAYGIAFAYPAVFPDSA